MSKKWSLKRIFRSRRNKKRGNKHTRPSESSLTPSPDVSNPEKVTARDPTLVKGKRLSWDAFEKELELRMSNPSTPQRSGKSSSPGTKATWDELQATLNKRIPSSNTGRLRSVVSFSDDISERLDEYRAIGNLDVTDELSDGALSDEERSFSDSSTSTTSRDEGSCTEYSDIKPDNCDDDDYESVESLGLLVDRLTCVPAKDSGGLMDYNGGNTKQSTLLRGNESTFEIFLNGLCRV